jgi:hypothetical protein
LDAFVGGCGFAASTRSKEAAAAARRCSLHQQNQLGELINFMPRRIQALQTSLIPSRELQRKAAMKHKMRRRQLLLDSSQNSYYFVPIFFPSTEIAKYAKEVLGEGGGFLTPRKSALVGRALIICLTLRPLSFLQWGAWLPLICRPGNFLSARVF